jgi:hypothetical protein
MDVQSRHVGNHWPEADQILSAVQRSPRVVEAHGQLDRDGVDPRQWLRMSTMEEERLRIKVKEEGGMLFVMREPNLQSADRLPLLAGGASFDQVAEQWLSKEDRGGLLRWKSGQSNDNHVILASCETVARLAKRYASAPRGRDEARNAPWSTMQTTVRFMADGTAREMKLPAHWSISDLRGPSESTRSNILIWPDERCWKGVSLCGRTSKSETGCGVLNRSSRCLQPRNIHFCWSWHWKARVA